MTVQELIEKLQTMPKDAKVVHVNYKWTRKTAFSNPDVFINSEGECVLASVAVGFPVKKEGKK